MNKIKLSLIALPLVLGVFLTMLYNNLINKQETVSQAFAQIQAVYQRRLDLIPNLVNIVSAYTKHEQKTLLQVTRARSEATRILNQGVPNDEHLNKLSQAQAQLTRAVGALMVNVERYPDLKASQNFLTLQAQLEGTENRIAVARERYNNAVKTYDTAIRKFPNSLIVAVSSSFKPAPYYRAQVNAAQAPTINFNVK